MSFIDQVDLEIVGALDAHQAERYSAIGENPPLARAMTDAVNREMRANLPPTDVEITEITIPGPDCDIPLAIYQPPGPGPRGGLLWLHGGGYIVGDERDDTRCIEIAEFVGCTVVSVGYRLAPESTFREIISDSFTALNWTVDHSSEPRNRQAPRRHWWAQRRWRLIGWLGAFQPRQQWSPNWHSNC